jgi:hypothetical protein
MTKSDETNEKRNQKSRKKEVCTIFASLFTFCVRALFVAQVVLCLSYVF